MHDPEYCFFTCDALASLAPLAPSVVKSIVPLRMGLVWRYRTTRFDVDGTVLTTEYTTSDIQRSVTLDREHWYSGPGSGDTGNFRANRADGLYTRYHSRYLGLDYWSPPKRNLKYPVQVGEVFTDENNNVLRVASVSRSASVHAGTFDCVLYISTPPDMDSSDVYYSHSDLYYSPGVGLVLAEYHCRSLEGMMFLTARTELSQAPEI